MPYLKGGFGDVPLLPDMECRPRPDVVISGPHLACPSLFPWTGCRVPAYSSHLTCVKPGILSRGGVWGGEGGPRGFRSHTRRTPAFGYKNCVKVPRSTATSISPPPPGRPCPDGRAPWHAALDWAIGRPSFFLWKCAMCEKEQRNEGGRALSAAK